MDNQETDKKNLSGDMTEGKILKPLLLFTLPMMLGNVFQQLYNTVDSVVVGRFVGGQALAAVGTSFPVIFLLVSLFMGIAMGGCIMVSQYFGAKDYSNLKKTVHTTITVTAALGIFVAILGVAASKPLLHLMNTPSDVFHMAYVYIVIVFIGIPGSLLYNVIGGILRGLGDSKSPLIFLIIASMMNVVLDLLFVVAFGWGVAGVAWATIISQAVSAVFAFFKLQRGEDFVRMTRKDVRIDKEILKKLLKLGLPSGLQDTAFSIGMMIIQAFTNSFGYSVMAAGNVVMKVDGFAVMPMFSISAAATTFIGQNIGAGKMDRVKKGTMTSIGLIIGIGGSLSALVVIFGPWLMRFFSGDQLVLEVGGNLLRILGPFYWMMGISFLLGGILRGAGDVVFAAVISIGAMVVVRIPMAYMMAVRTGDYRGLYISMVVGNAVGAILLFLRFLSGKWKNKAITMPKIQPVEETVPEETETVLEA
jgi:putative MATE family efflux protein